jgi:hypothetical protein
MRIERELAKTAMVTRRISNNILANNKFRKEAFHVGNH